MPCEHTLSDAGADSQTATVFARGDDPPEPRWLTAPFLRHEALAVFARGTPAASRPLDLEGTAGRNVRLRLFHQPDQPVLIAVPTVDDARQAALLVPEQVEVVPD